MNTQKLLLSQLRECYKEEGWFKPLQTVLKDISEEEIDFKMDENTHSIRQLINHLIFWNGRWLSRFKGNEPGEFEEANEITFEDSSKNQTGKELINRLNESFEEWDKELEMCSEEKLDSILFEGTDYRGSWSVFISSMILHSVYHLGQIMQIKKHFLKQE